MGAQFVFGYSSAICKCRWSTRLRFGLVSGPAAGHRRRQLLEFFLDCLCVSPREGIVVGNVQLVMSRSGVPVQRVTSVTDGSISGKGAFFAGAEFARSTVADRLTQTVASSWLRDEMRD
jgi:hypothetical protein